MTKYQSILPEHEPLLEVETHVPHHKQHRSKLGLALLLVLMVYTVLSSTARDGGTKEEEVSAKDADFDETDAEGTLFYTDESYESIDASFERLEEWKRQFQESWAPFWEDTKQKWHDFAENLGDDEKIAAEKTQRWWENFKESAGEWWDHTSTKTGEWFNREGHETSDWWNETSQKSGDWLNEEGQKTSEWWNETSMTSGEWLGEEGEKASGWWNEASDKSGKWVKTKEEQAGEWLDEAKDKPGKWFKKKKHQTAEWWNDTENTSEEWWDVTAQKTSDWWNETEERTAEWWDDARHNTRKWWNVSEHKTEDWFHSAGRWIRHEAGDFKDWWNETEHTAGDWWYNATHHIEDLPEYVIYMNDTAAYRMLTNGIGFIDFAHDYFLINQGYDAQMNQAYCGVASAAALLNSFRGMVDLPIDPIYDPYSYATQHDLFNECTDATVIHRNKTYDGIFVAPGGLSMSQVEALLGCNLDSTDWKVTAHYLDPATTSIEDFRKDLQETMADVSARVIINFDRKLVGQAGGGHWSPLGAFSPDFDAFLVMDVAKYKYPNAWVSTSLLYKSLQTYDTCGEWDFPEAQENLPRKFFRPSFHRKHISPTDVAHALTMLGCEPMRRGYITVKKL